MYAHGGQDAQEECENLFQGGPTRPPLSEHGPHGILVDNKESHSVLSSPRETIFVGPFFFAFCPMCP